MGRKELFKDTVTFETTGAEEPEEDLFLADASLNQKPDPGQRVTLQLELGSETGVSSAYVTAHMDGEEEADFGGISVDADDTATRSTIITAPNKDEFDVVIAGGIE